jgi:hypothetical protein
VIVATRGYTSGFGAPSDGLLNAFAAVGLALLATANLGGIHLTRKLKWFNLKEFVGRQAD